MKKKIIKKQNKTTHNTHTPSLLGLLLLFSQSAKGNYQFSLPTNHLHSQLEYRSSELGMIKGTIKRAEDFQQH